MDSVLNRINKMTKKKWGQECSLCSSRHGVPIECSALGCKTAYHTTCAIRNKLKMQALFGKNYKGGIRLRSYCTEHSPSIDTSCINEQEDKISASGLHEIDMTNMADDKNQQGSEELDFFWKYVDINLVHKRISDTRMSNKSRIECNPASDSSPKSPKKSDCTTKKKTPKSPTKTPAVPNNSDEAKEIDPLIVDLIYRYWILLRTANHGQSLIKFSPSALREREFEQRKNILKLRIELERIRNLTYMISRREKLKSSWLNQHHAIMKSTLQIINDIMPPSDQLTEGLSPNGKRNNHQHMLFDESEKLLQDLIDCDQIYQSNDNTLQASSSPVQSTFERRRTLSLVRRINRQLRPVNSEPSSNPYAKSYIVPRRSDSPNTSPSKVSRINSP